ncbi:MAG: hypothetical protein JNM94_16575 [Phycisphaerae bacterium]|nr:hypothetical protein [Phycisphaerae bacterium]
MAKSSASGIKAGRAYVELGVDDRFTKALRAAQARLQAFGNAVRNIGLGLTAVAAAASAPFVASVKLFSDFGSAIDDASNRTGLTAEAMSELGFAAEQSGTTVESLEKGLRVMQRTLVNAAEDGGAAGEAIASLGLSVDALRALSSDEQFAAIADRIAAIADPAERATVAMRIFGRAGAELVPLLAEGASGIGELRKQARDFGISVSGADAKAAGVLNDTLNLLSRAARGASLQIGAALAPAVTDLAERTARIVAATTAWIRANRDSVVWIAKTILLVGAAGIALVGLGLTISLLGTALGGIATAFGLAVKAVLAVKIAFLALASPIGIVAVALTGGVAAILYYTGAGGAALEWLRDRFGELRERVTAVLGAIGDALAAGDLALAARVAWLAIKAEWVRGTNFLQDKWAEFKAWFLTAWSETVGGIEIFAAEIWNSFEVAAAEAFAFVSRAWSATTGFFRSAWESVTGFIADRILEVMGLFDESLDVDAAKAERKRTDDATLAGVEKARAEEEARIAARLASRRSAAENRLADRRDAIGEGLVDDQKRITGARDKALADSAAELASAQEELRKAIEEARRARAAGSDEAGSPGTPSLADALAGLDGARAKSEVRGTFSAAAIQSLQAGAGGAIDRIARATEDTAKNVKRLLDKASSDGLVFQD